MADRLAGELDRHYKASSYKADDDLVFCHPQRGTVLDHSDLVRRFKRALRAGGVREVRFHDLRHTFGTRMAAAGVPMRTLQGWMGHRDFKTTLIPVMKEGSLSLVAKWVRPEQGQRETQAEGRAARMWAV